MTATPAYLHKIHQDRLCELLGVNPNGLHKLIRRKSFPTPTDSDEYGPFWLIKAVREWLAYSHYRPLASLLLEWWPDAEKPAIYQGAEPKRYRAADPEPAAVLQRWCTSHGATVVVCWPMSGHSTSVREYLRDWAADADAYLTIGSVGVPTGRTCGRSEETGGVLAMMRLSGPTSHACLANPRRFGRIACDTLISSPPGPRGTDLYATTEYQQSISICCCAWLCCTRSTTLCIKR
jgi:hypothetical protein